MAVRGRRSIADTYVSIIPETARVASEIARAFRATDREAREAGRRWKEEIDRQLGSVDADVDLDTAGARAEAERLRRDIEARNATLHVDVDRDRLASSLASSIAALPATVAPRAAAAGSEIGGSLTGGITSALGVILAGNLVATVVELGGVAAAASGAIGLIPAAAGAAALGVGSLAVATQGFGDALGAMRDPEEFAEALQGISPAAQQAALALQAVLPAWDSLQNTVQENLFAGVAGQINTLASTYLPLAESVMGRIAAATNTAFSGVFDTLMSSEAQAGITTVFDNVAKSFEIAAGAAGPFTQAIGEIIEVGSGFLPGIASAVRDAAVSFSSFISEAKANGSLADWIGTGLDTLRQVGTLVGNLTQDFMQLAPIGESLLPHIVSSLSAVGDAAVALAPVLVALGPAWDAIRFAAELASGQMDLLRTVFGKISDFASSTLGPAVTWLGDTFKAAFTVVETVVTACYGKVKPILDALGGAVSALTAPLQIMNNLLGGTPPAVAALPMPLTGQQPAQGGLPGASRERRGAAPVPTAPPPVVAAIPAGGYAVPVPTPEGSGTVSSPAASAYAGRYGYTSDAALLAGIPAGSYSQTGIADLTQGIGDCSSAIEDLIAIMDGRPTAGRSLSTGNADEWLAAHGFLPGTGGPGDFRVGFNAGHMQATLPGGTPFNWGSDNAAARRGIGGTGADDPAFTSNYYRPVEGTSFARGGTPATAGLPAMVGRGTADSPLFVAMTDQERQKNRGNGQFQGLGKDLGSGIMELFGFDGSLFGDPSQFGITKLFSGFANWATQPAGGGGDGASPMGGGGGGGGLIDGLLSFTPQAFGDLRVGSQKDARVPFMGAQPGVGGSHFIPGSQFVQGAIGAAQRQQQQGGGPNYGSGNSFGDNITINAAQSGADATAAAFREQHSLPRARQGVRAMS